MNKINEISLKELFNIILNNKFKLLIFNIIFLIPMTLIIINLDMLRTKYIITINDKSDLLSHEDFFLCSVNYETVYFPETFRVEFLALKKDLKILANNYICSDAVYHEDESYFYPQHIIQFISIYSNLIERFDFDKNFIENTIFENKDEFISYYKDAVSGSKVYANETNSDVYLLFKHKNNFKIDGLKIVLQNIFRDYYKEISFSKTFLEENKVLNTDNIMNEFKDYSAKVDNYVEDEKLKLISSIQEIGSDGEFDYQDIFDYLLENKFDELILIDSLRNIDKKIQNEVIETIKIFSINTNKSILGVKENVKIITKLNNSALDELKRNNAIIENYDYLTINKISSKVSKNALYITLISIIIYNFILLNLFIIIFYKKD
jgi:hypothetical protein